MPTNSSNSFSSSTFPSWVEEDIAPAEERIPDYEAEEIPSFSTFSRKKKTKIKNIFKDFTFQEAQIESVFYEGEKPYYFKEPFIVKEDYSMNIIIYPSDNPPINIVVISGEAFNSFPVELTLENIGIKIISAFDKPLSWKIYNIKNKKSTPKRLKMHNIFTHETSIIELPNDIALTAFNIPINKEKHDSIAIKRLATNWVMSTIGVFINTIASYPKKYHTTLTQLHTYYKYDKTNSRMVFYIPNIWLSLRNPIIEGFNYDVLLELMYNPIFWIETYIKWVDLHYDQILFKDKNAANPHILYDLELSSLKSFVSPGWSAHYLHKPKITLRNYNRG